jgi:hypothetical protein
MRDRSGTTMLRACRTQPTEGDRMVDERSALTAVLLGQTGEPQGPQPTEEEMTAWAARQLQGKRLIEVESHIAHDPATFERAMAQWRARSAAGTSSPLAKIWRAVTTWLAAPLPAFAAGVATLAIVALVALRLNSPDLGSPNRSPTEPVLRGSTVPPSDWRVVAFRAGYWQEEAAAAADRAAARADTFGCVDGEGCGAQVQQLVRFGELLAHLNAACRGGPDASQRLAMQRELGAIDAGMADSLELLPWRGYARELAADLAASASGACGRAEALRALLITD